MKALVLIEVLVLVVLLKRVSSASIPKKKNKNAGVGGKSLLEQIPINNLLAIEGKDRAEVLDIISKWDASSVGGTRARTLYQTENWRIDLQGIHPDRTGKHKGLKWANVQIQLGGKSRESQERARKLRDRGRSTSVAELHVPIDAKVGAGTIRQGFSDSLQKGVQVWSHPPATGHPNKTPGTSDPPPSPDKTNKKGRKRKKGILGLFGLQLGIFGDHRKILDRLRGIITDGKRRLGKKIKASHRRFLDRLRGIINDGKRHLGKKITASHRQFLSRVRGIIRSRNGISGNRRRTPIGRSRTSVGSRRTFGGSRGRSTSSRRSSNGRQTSSGSRGRSGGSSGRSGGSRGRSGGGRGRSGGSRGGSRGRG